MKKLILTALILAYLQTPTVDSALNIQKQEEIKPRKAIKQIIKENENKYPAVVEDKYQYPLFHWNENITSDFGRRKRPGHRYYENHTGIDIKGNCGDPIYSFSDGIVIYAGWLRGYGNSVVVMHQDGFAAIYAHGRKNSTSVSAGQEITKGTSLMKVGTTGISTGYHLHFEIRNESGIPINPLEYEKGGYWRPITNDIPQWIERRTFSGDKVVLAAGNYLNKSYIRNHQTR